MDNVHPCLIIDSAVLSYAEVKGQYEQLGYKRADGDQDGVDQRHTDQRPEISMTDGKTYDVQWFAGFDLLRQRLLSSGGTAS